MFQGFVRPSRHLLSKYSVLPQAPERQLLRRGTTKAVGRSWNLQQGSENRTNVLVNTCKLSCCFLRFIYSIFLFCNEFLSCCRGSTEKTLFAVLAGDIPNAMVSFLFSWMDEGRF